MIYDRAKKSRSIGPRIENIPHERNRKIHMIDIRSYGIRRDAALTKSIGSSLQFSPNIYNLLIRYVNISYRNNEKIRRRERF